ncbi:MAG: UbiD family decarboxylase [Chloroflexi bacterium]|nr:UbiD family decarboxylase [Chloroflexota bacterium]
MKRYDLRSYLEVLDERGDLRRIKEPVDPRLEVGALARHACECNGEAILFENIKGFPNFRMVGAFESYSSGPDYRMAKVAIALGLEPRTHPLEIVEKLAASRSAKPIDPVIVDSGPCQENVLLGEKAILSTLPVPLLHSGDGGPYLNTVGAFVMRTADKSWSNWAVARGMMVDERHFFGATFSEQHLGMVRATWAEDQRIPIALFLGAEPSVVVAAGAPLARHGQDESAYIGGYFGKPLELVRCKTVPLEVPANAEIVIEGRMVPDAAPPEGPMGEYHGYIEGGPISNSKLFALYEVTAITFRNDPIFPIVSAGKPVDEDHAITGPGLAAACLDILRREGVPVASAWMVPESAIQILAITLAEGWEKELKGASVDSYLMHIAEVLKNGPEHTHVGHWIMRILVTNDDVDITNPRDLWWAYATRCRPGDGSQLLEDVLIMPLLPMINTPQERKTGRGRIEILNCLMTSAMHDIKPATFADDTPAEMQSRLLSIYNSGIVRQEQKVSH